MTHIQIYMHDIVFEKRRNPKNIWLVYATLFAACEPMEMLGLSTTKRWEII